MSQQNVQAMRGLYDAFNRGDLDALEKGFSREILWNEAENSLFAAGNPYRGFTSVRDGVLLPTKREFDGLRVNVEQLHDAGDTVVATGRYRGRHRETGRELSSQFCHILHVGWEGKLDRFQEYVDTLQEAEVAGQVKIIEKVQIPHPVM